MSDDEKPFELEPEKDEPEPKPEPEPSPRPEPERKPSAPTYEERAVERAEDRMLKGAGEDEVDTRTVAERTGKDVPRGSESVGPPADWPREALSFPLRPPGIGFLVAGLVALLPLDVMGAVGAVAFLAWALKLLLVVFVLRAQIFVIGSSAAGRDVADGWRRALALEKDDLWPYARTLLAFVLLLAPGALVIAFSETFGGTLLGLLLLVLGSMYAAVAALGAALQDPSLKYPWRAFAWIGTRPLSCLVGSVGWWVLAVAEWGLAALDEPPIALVAALSVVLRVACFYALLVSARAIGVMGRSWEGD